jgi:hypothetical protein
MVQRRKLIAERRAPFPTIALNRDDCRSLSFMSDALATKRRFQTLGIIDTFTREVVAIEVENRSPLSRWSGFWNIQLLGAVAPPKSCETLD